MRKAVPRSSHAEWVPAPDRAGPVALLEAQGESRLPELLPIRYGRMAASPFFFYRGAAAIMAADLGARASTGIRVQLAGDAHLSNFGGFASPERALVFDLNDFDETHPGPWEWDVKRLAASFVVAGRAKGYGERQRHDLVLTTVGAYREAMRTFSMQTNLDVWYARLDVGDLLQRWKAQVSEKRARRGDRALAKAGGKDSLRAFDKLATVVDGEPRIISNPPLLVPLEDLLSDVAARKLRDGLLEILRRYLRTLPGDRRFLVEQYRLVDVARKVVGVGSVGTRAWIALMLGRDGGDPLFLQFKEAQESVLAPFTHKSRFGNQGQRVVEGQRLTQAASDIFLGWDRVEDLTGVTRDFYVRQLWDGKISADIAEMAVEGMRVYAEACGWTLARAHARSGDRVAIASYLGGSDAFDRAIAAFSELYAEQNERDHQALVEAVRDGRIVAEEGI